MKRPSWQALFGIGLIAASGFLYLLHYLVFRDWGHIFLWSFTSLAFLPVSVLFVTLIINRLLTVKQQQMKLQKMNMVIGAFFSEVGTHLLTCLSDLDPDMQALRDQLVVDQTWDKRRFLRVRTRLRSHPYRVDGERVNLASLKEFLTTHRDFLLRLLENPNLLEHEAFTALLRSVFHLAEELGFREDVAGLPDTDRDHLAGDVRRAYALLVGQWVNYMRFMKEHYPYLFSLAMRTNPFDQSASPVVDA